MKRTLLGKRPYLKRKRETKKCIYTHTQMIRIYFPHLEKEWVLSLSIYLPTIYTCIDMDILSYLEDLFILYECIVQIRSLIQIEVERKSVCTCVYECVCVRVYVCYILIIRKNLNFCLVWFITYQTLTLLHTNVPRETQNEVMVQRPSNTRRWSQTHEDSTPRNINSQVSSSLHFSVQKVRK